MNDGAATERVVLLYRSLYGPLVRYASHVSGSVDLAEEVVQEAFMRLYRTLADGRHVENPKAWISTVVRREIRKSIAADLHLSLDVLDNQPIGQWVAGIPGLERDEVTRLFSVLTAREEEVLVLRMQALKYREIAKALGISIKTVATLLARALRKLQAATRTEAQEQRIPPDVDDRPPRTLQ